MKVFPSLLAADFGKLNQEVASIEAFADAIHFDVMDGHFVPNLSMGASILAKIETNLVKDVHLMVTNPFNRFQEFINAGADRIAFHVEVKEDIYRNIKALKTAGIGVGLALSPETPVEELYPYLSDIDYVLIMAVSPGFGGQTFMPEVLDKVRTLKEKQPSIEVVIDGGINTANAVLCQEAWADALVAGTTIFDQIERYKVVKLLRGI